MKVEHAFRRRPQLTNGEHLLPHFNINNEIFTKNVEIYIANYENADKILTNLLIELEKNRTSI